MCFTVTDAVCGTGRWTNGRSSTLWITQCSSFERTSTTAKGLIGQVVLRYRCVSDDRVHRSPGAQVYIQQGLGSILIRKIDGDYNNVVGFPGASFFQFLDRLVEEEVDFLQI